MNSACKVSQNLAIQRVKGALLAPRRLMPHRTTHYAKLQSPRAGQFLHRIIQIQPVRWPSGLRRQLKVLPSVVHQHNRWSERAWVQIPLSSIYLLLLLGLPSRAAVAFCLFDIRLYVTGLFVVGMRAWATVRDRSYRLDRARMCVLMFSVKHMVQHRLVDKSRSSENHSSTVALMHRLHNWVHLVYMPWTSDQNSPSRITRAILFRRNGLSLGTIAIQIVKQLPARSRSAAQICWLGGIIHRTSP